MMLSKDRTHKCIVYLRIYPKHQWVFQVSLLPIGLVRWVNINFNNAKK